MKRICVTGPESTGKTTLARRLAELLGTECVPEAARAYAESVGRVLTQADVEPIARAHLALADAAAERAQARGAEVLVLDTDLVSTIVYGRHYYDFASAWLEGEAEARRADVYLLCDVDVPWIADGIRDRPENRAAMLALFREALVARGAHVVNVRGSWAERQNASLTFTERFLGARVK